MNKNRKNSDFCWKRSEWGGWWRPPDARQTCGGIWNLPETWRLDSSSPGSLRRPFP